MIGHALAIVDRDGPDGVTMRRLAHELGVTPMALYNHVADKQAVLDAVAERVAAEVGLPAAERPWDERLKLIFTELRTAYLRHPNAATLIQTATAPSPGLLDPMEATLHALADAGLPPNRAVPAWTTLVAFTNGHVGYQIHGHLHGDTASAFEMDSDRFPRVAQAIADDFDWDHAFREGLERLIAALQAPRPSDPDQ